MEFGPEYISERERIARMRDFSYDELEKAVPLEIAQAIDLFQLESLRNNPSPQKAFPDKLDADRHIANSTYDALQHNTAIYNDDIEEFLDEDPILLYLYAAKQSGLDTESRTLFIRARRSIVVRLLPESLIETHAQTSDSSAA